MVHWTIPTTTSPRAPLHRLYALPLQHLVAGYGRSVLYKLNWSKFGECLISCKLYCMDFCGASPLEESHNIPAWRARSDDWRAITQHNTTQHNYHVQLPDLQNDYLGAPLSRSTEMRASALAQSVSKGWGTRKTPKHPHTDCCAACCGLGQLCSRLGKLLTISLVHSITIQNFHAPWDAKVSGSMLVCKCPWESQAEPAGQKQIYILDLWWMQLPEEFSFKKAKISTGVEMPCACCARLIFITTKTVDSPYIIISHKNHHSTSPPKHPQAAHLHRDRWDCRNCGGGLPWLPL